MGAHPADLGVAESAAALRAGRVSAEELAAACLERIGERDHAFGAWRRVDPEAALAAARRADRRRAAGGDRPLLGVPVALKDVIGVAGRPLTAGSALLSGNVAREDATAWRRLRDAGMVLLGHVQCGELSCGTWGRNPWDPAFSPGGSSSGSAIAVATRTVAAAIGTDSRGSIRIPAGFNGVTGMKPSFGLVSTAGCIPIAYSYDTVGPLARSAEDCALLLEALAGPDGHDPATLAQPAGAMRHVAGKPLARVRLGVPRDLDALLAPDVGAVFEAFRAELQSHGATLVSVDRPAGLPEAASATILAGEASAIHAQFAGREHLYRAEFGEHFDPLLEQVGSAVDYVRAQMARVELAAAWRAIFAAQRLDALIEPGVTGAIWRAGEALDLHAHPWLFGAWNDANFPVLMLPAGRCASDGAPVGIQVVGLPFHDAAVLRIGVEYQASTAHHRAEPPDLDRAAEREPYPSPAVPDAGPQPPYVPPPHPFDAFLVR